MVAQWLARWRSRREDAAVARRAIPDDLWKRTLVRYPFLRWRSTEDQLALRRMTSLFLDRKEFSAGAGLRLTDAIAVAIAAQACVPVLQLGLSHYDGFVGIVVHADQVRARREVHDDSGIVHEYDDVLAGEAVPGGPVMLSWADVREGGRSAGYNVVIHEFAHVLDLRDGAGDGVPPLPASITRAQWLAVLEPEFAAFTARVDRDPELDSALDPYAATGIDEFFAVASESFFVDPHGLAAEHPALYALLARFYRQDPKAFAAEARGR